MSDIDIVVGTFDKYVALWEPLKHGFDKYWKDRPWKVRFITGLLDAPIGFESIKTGNDKGWGEQIRRGLKQVNTEIILWTLDDLWITGPVNTGYLGRFVSYMNNFDIDHIRLLPPAYEYRDKIKGGGRVSPERECKHVSDIDPKLWVFKDDAEYRASVTVGLWKKEVFERLLQNIDTPWEFEAKASKLTLGNDRYLCNVDPYLLPTTWYCNPFPNGKNSVLSRGTWDPAAYEYARHEGLKIDFSMHPNGKPNENCIPQ